ncbi:TlpA disulfide reductase family protein [Halalkalibacter sp. AB-rgal2]|uniref:TlpA disulfide reductase family protein n=1 Tax=Halalkalibacter sp. AB-rgal2 TaxID=3242695 RepID=UPI00359CD523
MIYQSKQIFYRAALIVLLCVVGFMYSQSQSTFQQLEESVANMVKPGVQIGQQAKEFSLHTLSGKNVSLNDYRGQGIVLHFFATWCAPCQEEMPLIVALDERLKKAGRELVVVNLTSQEQSKSEVKPFLDYFRASFDPMMDEEGDVMELYEVIGIPTTLVIDEDGIVLERINGMLSEEIIDSVIFKQ